MMPESYPKRASRVPIAGWEVELARQSIAPSTTSAPAKAGVGAESAGAQADTTTGS